MAMLNSKDLIYTKLSFGCWIIEDKLVPKKIQALRIMGSQNWGFGDPRTLLYRELMILRELMIPNAQLLSEEIYSKVWETPNWNWLFLASDS